MWIIIWPHHDEYLPIKSMTDETVNYYNTLDFQHFENSILI